MIYHIEMYENPDQLTESEFEQYLAVLPDERRAKVKRFYNKIDQKLSLLAYILLRRGLERWYNIKLLEELRFVYNKNEKPFLADYPHIYFNISHCHQTVVCVFAEKPIGVDVEGVISYDQGLVERVANKREQLNIVNDINPSLALTLLWTKKESFMKMIGTGLVDDLHAVFDADSDKNYHFEHHYSEAENYVMTICF